MKSFMKKIFGLPILLVFLTLACTVSVNNVPTAETTPVLIEPATTTPEVFIALTQAIPASPIPAADGVAVSYESVSLILPTELASGHNSRQIERAAGEDVPTWGQTPGHIEITLEGYLLQGKLHEAQLYVYPALEYAQLVPAAFESMHRIRNAMNVSGAVSLEQLPAVPFFNATPIFASNYQTISFQNGSGIRFLTEYAQYFAPVNNHELVYQFQGFSADGETYIIAIFPLTAPVLAETSDAGAPLPPGGIPYPDVNDANADWPGYYASITDLLNATSPEAFTPSITQLDRLIQSMQITP